MYNRNPNQSNESHPRRILVTGASSRIGEAVSRSLEEPGDIVFACARRLERLQELSETSFASVIPCEMDVTDSQGVAASIAQIQSEQGSIDVAILNSGGYRPCPRRALILSSVSI